MSQVRPNSPLGRVHQQPWTCPARQPLPRVARRGQRPAHRRAGIGIDDSFGGGPHRGPGRHSRRRDPPPARPSTPRRTRRLVSNTAVGGTDVEETGRLHEGGRPPAYRVGGHPRSRPGRRAATRGPAAAWTDEHPPAGIAGWQTHKRTPSAKAATGRSRDGQRPLTRDTLWDRDARLAVSAQVATPVAADGHSVTTDPATPLMYPAVLAALWDSASGCVLHQNFTVGYGCGSISIMTTAFCWRRYSPRPVGGFSMGGSVLRYLLRHTRSDTCLSST